MRRFRSRWIALAALFWLPAFAHCQLEVLPGLEFLRCADEATASNTPAEDCADCCLVEKSGFCAAHSRISAPAPARLPVFMAASLLPDNARLPRSDSLRLTAARPDLPPRRHFLARTALPARAPTFVS